MPSESTSEPPTLPVSELRRSRIIALAILLAVVGAVMPIAAVLYASWSFAIKAEQNRLEILAARVISRADQSVAEARRTLATLEASRLEPCSPAHIEQMRRQIFDGRAIEEVGYVRDGVLACTSWGPVSILAPQAPSDLTLPGGIDVTLHARALVSDGQDMLALHRGAYMVLVDPLRLLDISVDPGTILALATAQGQIIAQMNSPDTGLVQAVIAAGRAAPEGTHLFGIARRDAWRAVALVPRADVLDNLRHEQLALLPVGALAAACIAGGVIWLSRRRLSPLAELALAVRNREFVVHYQPIMDLRSGACVGAEALVRWRRPDGSRVRPDLFIPLAEESGLILPITDQVIAGVVADLGPLLADAPALHVAINLCADDLRTGRVLPVIGHAVAGTGIRLEQIWLEATERSFLHIETAYATLTRAREAGHRIAIDDFGTGHSSLHHLQDLPVDALKIDKSFIDTIGRDSATSAVTPHIIDMAQTLKLRTVAEGIEDKAQLDYLVAHGVAFGQGWLFARPMPGPEFQAFYARNREKHGAPAPATSPPRAPDPSAGR